LAAAALALLAVATTAPAAAPRNTVFLGGAIYTLNDRQPWATALVVSGHRIAYVGDDKGARAYATGGARVMPLTGRMMLPGFHDPHAHPMSGAMRLLRCSLTGLATMQAVEAAIRTCAKTHRGDKWLVAYGWPRELFRDGTRLRAELDGLVPDRPAYLATSEGFAAWVNSRALAAVGIAPNGAAPDIAGLERDPHDHRPTGVVTGVALERLHAAIPRPGEREYREAFRRWSAMASAFGITSVFDAAATAPMVEAYHAADLAGELKLRVLAAQLVDGRRGPQQVGEMAALRDRVRGPYFRADAAKIFLDGEIAMHTAALLAPYADEPRTRGDLIVQSDALKALVKRLDADGFLIHMHVMGDRAVRAGLDALEQAAEANGPRDRRPQLAHVGVIDPGDILRFGKLGVAANFQPVWFQPDDPAFAPTEAVLGPSRARWMYPMGSFAARGVRIVAASDWPATSLDPLDGIQAAVTRQPLDGGKPARQPGERIDLALALAAYTRNAAWVAREDKIDGALEVGKAADLVVLDRNLFATPVLSLHKARVLLTMLDGRPVYRARNFPWP
jgi:predicted amidohydrolase YtcJ